VRNPAGEFDDLEAALQRAARVGKHLAVLTRDQPRQFVGVLFDEMLEFEQHRGAARRRRCRPLRPGPRRGGGCAIDILRIAQAYPRGNLSGGGLVNIRGRGAGPGHARAVDIMTYGFHSTPRLPRLGGQGRGFF
jgi:hypothetical protein